MKKRIYLHLVFLTAFPALFAQNCCMMSSSQEFAMLGSDKSFASSHLSPLPFHYTPRQGTFISFPTSDGKEGRAFMVKGSSNKVIFMFHEWWGLNDYIQREAEKLQKELGDVSVMAIDLYDGKVASTPEEAGKLMQAVNENRAKAIINGAIKYVGTDKHIGTIGWCFGGGWSLQAAILAGKQADACVMYYGMPEKDREKLKIIHAPVLGLFAGKDAWITPEKVNEFKNDMEQEGKKITIKFYDADHAFANPSNPKYNKEAGDDAWQRSIAFLREYLKLQN